MNNIVGFITISYTSEHWHYGYSSKAYGKSFKTLDQVLKAIKSLKFSRWLFHDFYKSGDNQIIVTFWVNEKVNHIDQMMAIIDRYFSSREVSTFNQVFKKQVQKLEYHDQHSFNVVLTKEDIVNLLKLDGYNVNNFTKFLNSYNESLD